MAEYINREDVNFRCSYHGDCMGSGSKCDKCSDNVINYQDFTDIPTADVVERFKYEMMAERCKTMTKAFIELQKDNKDLHSKLAKAIKEITEYRDDEKNDFCEVEVGAINGALAILKKI